VASQGLSEAAYRRLRYHPHAGDGRKLEQWYGYGEAILAAADGAVVEANQAPGVANNPPVTPLPTPEQLGLKPDALTNTLITIDRFAALLTGIRAGFTYKP